VDIGVVIPTKDRLENLELLLASLRRQTRPDFAIVVADDGSTDGTREMVESQSRDPVLNGRLRWVGCGPLGNMRARARNIGLANLPAETSVVVMLDSDLILQDTAIEMYAGLHKRFPDVVILGPVERLPPLPKADVSACLAAGQIEALRERVPPEYQARLPTGGDEPAIEVGPDYRPGMFLAADGKPGPMVRFGPAVNNAAWPLAAVWSLGGMDERMHGWGHEDLEFAARAAQAGLHCSYQPGLWALHVWHPQPPRSGYEWQRNLDYYLRRHADPEMELGSDWSLWFHYHAERGGSVVRCLDSLWAVSRSGEHRLGLPGPEWAGRLGHCGHEIPVVSPEVLAAALDHGSAEAGSPLGG